MTLSASSHVVSSFIEDLGGGDAAPSMQLPHTPSAHARCVRAASIVATL